jgi:putative SOS response-associated peptidase YedK
LREKLVQLYNVPMCARATLKSPDRLTELRELRVTFPGGLKPRFNIAPTQPILVARLGSDGAQECSMLRWGLIPSYTKQLAKTPALINARAETLAEKFTFRHSFQRRRCLVPADGFYEWRGEKGKRQPFYIHMPGGSPFCFAGIWDRWIDPDGKAVDSCTIITTEANEFIRPLHDRMPVILPQPAFGTWLDPHQAAAELEDLLRPLPDDALTMYAVGSLVNSGRVDRPECIQPWGGPTARRGPALWEE